MATMLYDRAVRRENGSICIILSPTYGFCLILVLNLVSYPEIWFEDFCEQFFKSVIPLCALRDRSPSAQLRCLKYLLVQHVSNALGHDRTKNCLNTHKRLWKCRICVITEISVNTYNDVLPNFMF